MDEATRAPNRIRGPFNRKALRNERPDEKKHTSNQSENVPRHSFPDTAANELWRYFTLKTLHSKRDVRELIILQIYVECVLNNINNFKRRTV